MDHSSKDDTSTTALALANILAGAATLWIAAYGRPKDGYSTTGNLFLHAAEAAYFDAIRSDEATS